MEGIKWVVLGVSCAWEVSNVMTSCSVVAILIMADMVCLSCMQKLWST